MTKHTRDIQTSSAAPESEPARGLLRLAVFGSPEVVHDGRRLTFALRKAQALLLYLAVEGGMHLRSKLAAFLWPDSEPHDARNALRNALALLRRLLDDVSPVGHSHLLIEGELLGLNPQAPVELDLQVVQLAYTEAQRFATLPAEPQRTALLTQVQHALALVRGSFLDGLVLGEDAPFNEWLAQQQRQWQVRLQLLFERLSAWQEVAGEVEQARATLTRWLGLDPLSEEAARRLMRVHLALGNTSAAWQVYVTCRTHLAEELGVKPSAETLALAEHIRTLAARNPERTLVRPSTAESQPPTELVGRATAFSQLVGHYQLARAGQPQAVLIVGEAGIGKTRLAREFVAWARAQGAEILSGQAFEAGGRLPYQLLVEALRPRLEEENAPEDLLDDLWLAELSRLLPELRVRYPDLPAPTQDELAAKLRLFEAVVRLVDALAQHGPLVLLLDDLQWVDGASLDLLRYLGRHWIQYGSRVLLLGTLRSEGVDLNPQLSAQLSDLSRDLLLTQVHLEPLSQQEVLQLIQALLTEEALSGRPPEGRGERALAWRTLLAEPAVSPASQRSPIGLGDFLYAQTGGQPFYLLETLKLLRDRQLLVPRLAADGTWKLEPTAEMAVALVQERSRHELLPPSVRAMIQAGLAKLQSPARQLVMASAVLGKEASAKQLWQLGELGEQAGLEALEEAVTGGLLREEAAGRQGAGQPGRYRFAHQLMRDVVYADLGEARRHLLHQRALTLLQTAGARSAELAYHALMAGKVEDAYRYSMQAGDEAVAIFAIEDAMWHYEQARALFQDQVQQTKLELFPARGLPSMPVQDPASQTRVNLANVAEVERLYVCLGRGYAFLNAWEQAQEAYEELLAYAQQQRLPGLVCMTLNRMAILAVQQTFDKPKVQALLDEAWHMAQTSHDQRALAETEWNQAQITALVWQDPTSALPHLQRALALARSIHDKELEARSLSSLGLIHLRVGDFQEAIHCVEASLALYAALGSETSTSRELSLASLTIGAPLTQPLTNSASEAVCWGMLAFAQVHVGQAHDSIRSGHKALALSQESKNVWTHVNSTTNLLHGLLDVGAYEEAFVLTQQTMPLARILPLKAILQRFLTAFGSVYQSVQQWEEARAALEEAEAIAETLDLGPLRMPALTRLCMHYALAGEWEQAYRYALKAIAIRKHTNGALIMWDFCPHYEMEALLHGGDERQAREAVQRLREHQVSSPRFRIPYLRSLAVLAAWDGESEQAIGHLREADQLAADLGLPGERWQILAALGNLYETRREQEQAHTAFAEAASIIQELAQGIEDETLRSRFLASPHIHQVVQQARGKAFIGNPPGKQSSTI